MMNVQKGHVVVTDYDTIEPGPFGLAGATGVVYAVGRDVDSIAVGDRIIFKAAWNYAIRIDGSLMRVVEESAVLVHIPAEVPC